MENNNFDFPISISDDDTFYLPNHGRYSLPRIFKYTELIGVLKRKFVDDFNNNDVETLLSTGIACELKRSDGSSCQKGKLRITVEFIPDMLELLPQTNLSGELQNEPSLLDVFRQSNS